MSKFKLEFDNGVIEHLGIKLYQNKPTNVIAEFVSNAWDADATIVDIELIGGEEESRVVVSDNGIGMSRDEIIEKFLVIGRNRRKSPSDTSVGGRNLMGRKGIGKLAGFGIAMQIDIIARPNATLRKNLGLQFASTEDGIYWLRFELDKLVNKSGRSIYEPKVLADGSGIEDFKNILTGEEGFRQLQGVEKIVANEAGGFCVVLSKITLRRTVPTDALLSSLGGRFTVTLLKPDFRVTVNGKEIEVSHALPPFQNFGFGCLDKPVVEKLTVCGIEREIRYWVKFVDLADNDWSIENAGVGIFAHGKIAQDRPFFFGVKGKEISSRYLYGVIEADWLDDLPEDLVSTDRRSINWEHEATQVLYDWGSKKILEWLTKYREWRESLPKVEIIKQIRQQNIKLSGQEEESLASLISEIFIDLGNNQEAKQKTLTTMTSAWTHEPTRVLTKSLWGEVFKGTRNTAEAFNELIEQLRASIVPEAMGLAVTMAQRIAAITAMNKMIQTGRTETHLQRLIEKFPWLLDPNNDFLTANQEIRTLVTTKHKPDPEFGEWNLNTSEGKLKPDFVFLSDPDTQRRIVVYEIKGPEHDKTLQPGEYHQLVNYLNIIERVYNSENLEIRGILIGHEKGGIKVNDNRVTVMRWSDVLLAARKLHVEYLVALLKSAKPSADDTRLRQIADFGGRDTIELINRYTGYLELPEGVVKVLFE